MAGRASNQNNQQYWQAPPPRPQDASTARDRLNQDQAQGYQQSAAGQGQVPPAYTYSPPQYDTPQHPQRTRPYVGSKDHVAAGLLGIFLGSLGIHKFYLGYNTAGFIMLGVTILGSLITFGLAGAVMSLIGFVEGIIYLTKNQSEFNAIYIQGFKEWF